MELLQLEIWFMIIQKMKIFEIKQGHSFGVNMLKLL